MKILNKVSAFIFILAVVFSCDTDEDKLYSFDYLLAPINVSAIFDITQDNTGLMNIVPSADGAQKYTVNFGDGSDEEVYTKDDDITHIYAEGVYTVTIYAIGLSDLKSEAFTKEITVSLSAPENLIVTAESDIIVSKQVNISAVADFATVFELVFEEGQEPVIFLPGETVSYVFAEAGEYQVTLIAKSAAVATNSTTFTVTAVSIFAPTSAAVAPPLRAASYVVSIFSDSYDNVENVNLNPNWGQSTVVTTETIDDNEFLKYATLNYQGTDFGGNQDVSGMDFLHVDMWTADAETVDIYCISAGAETPFTLTVTPESWTSYDIPLSAFSSVVDLTGVFQFKVVGTDGSTIYLDNLYFYKETAVITTGASVPMADAADVISVFSDSYSDVTGINFNPNWGQSTIVTTETIDGNVVLKYAALNYQGTDFSSHIDASEMKYLHVDMWTADASEVSLYCISTDPSNPEASVEKSYALPIVNGEWKSYDILLLQFSDVVDMSDLFQFKITGTNGSTIYLDNLYFHK